MPILRTKLSVFRLFVAQIFIVIRGSVTVKTYRYNIHITPHKQELFRENEFIKLK